MATDTRTVEKFNGENFHTWQVKMRLLLTDRGLWDVVIGTTPAPPKTAHPDDIASWKEKDLKATALIGLGLGDSQLHHLDLEQPSSETWNKLSTIFGAKSKNAKLLLKQKFFSLKLGKDQSVADHINEMKSIMTQLAGIQAKVDDDDAIAVLLISMPHEYHHTVTTLSTLPNQTFDSCVSTLLEEERKMKASSTSQDPMSEKALYTKTKTEGSNDRKPRRKCHYCGKNGHVAKDCWKKIADKKKEQDGDEIVNAESNFCSSDTAF